MFYQCANYLINSNFSDTLNEASNEVSNSDSNLSKENKMFVTFVQCIIKFV